MQANKRKLSNVLDFLDPTAQFKIPIFQRDFDWNKEQFEQLWMDMQRVGRDEKREHFFGSIVFSDTETLSPTFSRYLIVDGQQRLTTVLLLLIALRDHACSSAPEKSEARKFAERFLINDNCEDLDMRRKLVLRDKDDKTFSWLIGLEEKPLPAQNSKKIEIAYQYFKKRLDKEPCLSWVEKSLKRLRVVDVRLDPHDDDVQQVFESLNTTGINLREADKVRNLILMRLEEKVQTDLYKRYWQKIERLFHRHPDQLENFLRDFIALDDKRTSQVKKDQIYAKFRLSFENDLKERTSLEALLTRLLEKAQSYAPFVTKSESFPVFTDIFNQIYVLSAAPIAMLIMQLLHLYTRGHTTEKDVKEAFEILESYLFRRAVVSDAQTRSYWVHFSKLAYTLNEDDVLGSLKAGLHVLRESNSPFAFPTDAEFFEALQQKELYHKKVCKTLLETLEINWNKEGPDMEKCTIEHIMPQNENLNTDWKKMLGEDWRRIQHEWLHRLGNLTLTKRNSELSDAPFNIKITKVFNDSPYRLNQYVREQDTWNEKSIKTRGEELATRALKIWTNYK